MNIAFIHIPKTAGFYITKYLETRVLNDYEKLNSWELGLNRDWTYEELTTFIYKDKSFVHNHLTNWSPEAFKLFQGRKWKLFSFFRHPGDRLCSLYCYLETKMPEDIEGLTMEEFILRRSNFPAYPVYWRHLNYFDIFSDTSFSNFLKLFFNHTYDPIVRINLSKNLGYEYYCKNGEISKKAQKTIENSENFRLYKHLSKTPIVNI